MALMFQIDIFSLIFLDCPTYLYFQLKTLFKLAHGHNISPFLIQSSFLFFFGQSSCNHSFNAAVCHNTLSVSEHNEAVLPSLVSSRLSYRKLSLQLHLVQLTNLHFFWMIILFNFSVQSKTSHLQAFIPFRSGFLTVVLFNRSAVSLLQYSIPHR